jgi:hypothetical protein
MIGPDPRWRRLGVRLALWTLGVGVATVAVRDRGNPGLALLGFFALAFVCWDGAFLLRHAWRALRAAVAEGAVAEFAADPSAAEVVALPLIPTDRAWASCEGRWVEVELIELAGESAREPVDVVLEPIDGRLAVCPIGGRPPVPLELVAMQALACRLEGGALVVVSPAG